MYACPQQGLRCHLEQLGGKEGSPQGEHVHPAMEAAAAPLTAAHKFL